MFPEMPKLFVLFVFPAIYMLLCCLVGWMASAKLYRSFLGWTLLALIFSPITAFLFLLVAGIPMSATDIVQSATPFAQKFPFACDCGALLMITKGEAGTDRMCSDCGATVSIPKYSELVAGISGN